MPKRLEPNLPTGDILHSWTVEEFVQYARSRAWYVFMFVIGLALVGYGIFTNNFLFALVIILVAIILFLHAHQSPLEVPFNIAELGVAVGDRWYPYEELDSFYIIYNPPEVKMVFFEPKNLLRPRLRVPLQDMNPVEVRQTLTSYLPEDTERTEEPISDMIARHWRIL